MTMQPVRGRPIGPSVPPPGVPAGAPGAAARAAASSGRDAAVAAAPVRSLEELLGRAPPGAARGAAALLGPPPGAPVQDPAVPRFAAVSAALRAVSLRAQAAGRPDDALARAAAALPEGGPLRAAIECEQRLARVVGELCGMRDRVAAGMAAVSTG
jgi:hypothetical protein